MTVTVNQINQISLHLVASEDMAMEQEHSVRSITSGMVQGNDQAWLHFHRRYYLSLLRYAVSRCQSPDDSSEIIQHVYLRVARHIKAFEHETELWRWLACVVRCAVVDHQRGIRRRALLLEKFAHWQENQHSVVGTPPVEMDFQSRTQEALAQLPPNDAALLRLKYYEGWSVKQIAENTQSTPKAVENRLARLRERLRTMILEIQ